LKEFEYFLKRGEVKRQSKDKNLSDACLRESRERLILVKTILKGAQPKYVLENAYEAMREAADAVLFAEGYKSYSHEASIVYLSEKGISMTDLIEFDRFRRIRNGIKYYGKDCIQEDSEQAIQLAARLIQRIEEMLGK